jgi:hypothetical protein
VSDVETRICDRCGVDLYEQRQWTTTPTGRYCDNCLPQRVIPPKTPGSLDMDAYSLLTADQQQQVHEWVDAHIGDHGACIGYDIDGDAVTFHLNARNESGSFYVDESTGEVAHETRVVPLLSPEPV